ncbi:MAG: VOC family protein [bacterium]
MATHEVFAYLCVHDAKAAIDYYCEAFGGRELFRLVDPSGVIGHAEIDLDGHTLMISDEFLDFGIKSARTIGATAVTIHLHVDDADEVVAKAVAAGGTLERAVKTEFYGERSGVVRCPFGHRWLIGHEVEKVSPEEMQRRYDAMG